MSEESSSRGRLERAVRASLWEGADLLTAVLDALELDCIGLVDQDGNLHSEADHIERCRSRLRPCRRAYYFRLGARERTPLERWGGCCPFDPECGHSHLDLDSLMEWVNTPITDSEAAAVAFPAPLAEVPHAR